MIPFAWVVGVGVVDLALVISNAMPPMQWDGGSFVMPEIGVGSYWIWIAAGIVIGIASDWIGWAYRFARLLLNTVLGGRA